MDQTRRGFLKIAGVAAVGGALAGCGDSSSSTTGNDNDNQNDNNNNDNNNNDGSTGDSAFWLPEKWDREADVVVIGYGFAGACAALAAKDAGAEVIVLEKSATAEGGNSGVCAGLFHDYFGGIDAATWAAKINAMNWGSGPDADAVNAYVTAALETGDWLQNTLGMPLNVLGGGAMAQMKWNNQRQGESTATGMDVFAFENDLVTKRGIPVLFGTPATQLVQNPQTKEILGVKAKTGVSFTAWSRQNPSAFTGGTDLYVKARKAVIVACGGYENNPDIQYNANFRGVRIYPWGTPNNTGDGITMAEAVGARIRHMPAMFLGTYNFKVPTEQYQFSMGAPMGGTFPASSYIFVNKYGKRFVNEAASVTAATGRLPVMEYDPAKHEFANQPFFMVFDDAMMKAGPLAAPMGISGFRCSYYSVHQKYQWSADNGAEVQAGWIYKADTLEELAALMKGTDCEGNAFGVDAAGLAATVATYNGNVAGGSDPEQGRPASKLAPLSASGPYYAIEMGVSVMNTAGGPTRNAKLQAVGVDGNPIPRLYVAGECGSVNGFEYVAGGVMESHTTGRVAGQNAAKESAWE